MLGPLLFVYKGFLVIFFTKNIFITIKKIQKKSITKKLFTERKFEKFCEAKKMHKGHISGRKKNFNQKKSKLKAWHSYKKLLKIHFRDPKKHFYFNFVF